MKYSITDWSSKKYGQRCRITINIKSIKNLDLFKKTINKKVDCTGRDSTKGVLHGLIPSTRSLKYYVNGTVDDAYDLISKVQCEYYLFLDKLI